MKDTVKSSRKYSSPLRAMRAAATRSRILAISRELFTSQGYAATTVTQIAEGAEVSVDTLYATVGRKPRILREVVETAISGNDHAVPAEERSYVVAINAAADAVTKLRSYADAVADMSQRTSPIFSALRDGSRTDVECALLDTELSERRAANMVKFAAELRTTGTLRPDISEQFVADTIWATAGWEHYTQLVAGRGWTPTQFGDYLCESWTRLFLIQQPGRP